MAVLPIKVVPDPVLSRRAAPVERVTRRIQRLIKDMADTMYDAPGVGLAAPQVGVSKRVIVVDVGDGPIALVNPRVIKEDGLEVDVEGCLSIPGVTCYVERAASVEVEGLDEKGVLRRVQGDGLLARALQHELDHLDGILMTDIAESIVPVDEDTEEAGEPMADAAAVGGSAAGPGAEEDGLGERATDTVEVVEDTNS